MCRTSLEFKIVQPGYPVELSTRTALNIEVSRNKQPKTEEKIFYKYCNVLKNSKGLQKKTRLHFCLKIPLSAKIINLK